jgi:Tfp pilus assembly ATPase PilU
MQTFDGELDRLIRAGVLDLETGLGYASNAGNLRLELSDLAEAEASASRS